MSQAGRLSEQTKFETLTGNTGGPVPPNAAGNINFVGSAPYTVSGNPGTFTLTITDNGTLAYTYTADAGSATPAANNLNILGTAAQGISTSGAASTITITAADSSDTQKGVLEIATNAEAIAGVSGSLAIVPSNLPAVFASPFSIGNTAPNTGAFTVLQVDNIHVDANTISSTDTNGNIILTPNGSGKVVVSYATENAIPVFGASSIVSEIGPLTDGQLVIGATGGAPASANLTSTGGTVTITNSTNSINLETTGGLLWNVETGTTANIAVNNGYIGNNAAGVTFTLPATAAVGDRIRVTGLQASWTIAQNAGQTVYFGNQSSATGVGGSLASTHARDAVEMVCVVANNDFQILSSVGNITVT